MTHTHTTHAHCTHTHTKRERQTERGMERRGSKCLQDKTSPLMEAQKQAEKYVPVRASVRAQVAAGDV